MSSQKARHLSHGRDPAVKNHAEFIWSVADMLRGDYKRSEYRKVMLPLTGLRRLDCILAPSKEQVLARDAKLERRLADKGPVLSRITDVQFHNASRCFGNGTRAINDPEERERYQMQIWDR